MSTQRGGDLNLDQMMAFAVSDDHDRRVRVLDQLDGDLPAS